MPNQEEHRIVLEEDSRVLEPTLDVWMPLVSVGDAGNKADPTTGHGAVADYFSIGKYDVTAGQYCVFLNAVAAEEDRYHLYDPRMATDKAVACIKRSTTSEGKYSYELLQNGSQSSADLPITYVDLYSAARFCNWMEAGGPFVEGNKTTESGAYSLNGRSSGELQKNAEAVWFLPSEDQLYKSTYYKQGGLEAGYYLYPNRSNQAPTNWHLNQGDNEANYQCFERDFNGDAHGINPVGFYSKSQSPYDAFDTGGNIDQWSSTSKNTHSSLNCYIIRGGSWKSTYSWIGMNDLQPSSRRSVRATTKSNTLGFRLASNLLEEGSSIPAGEKPTEQEWTTLETATTAMTMLGFLCIGGIAVRKSIESPSLEQKNRASFSLPEPKENKLIKEYLNPLPPKELTRDQKIDQIIYSVSPNSSSFIRQQESGNQIKQDSIKEIEKRFEWTHWQNKNRILDFYKKIKISEESLNGVKVKKEMEGIFKKYSDYLEEQIKNFQGWQYQAAENDPIRKFLENSLNKLTERYMLIYTLCSDISVLQERALEKLQKELKPSPPFGNRNSYPPLRRYRQPETEALLRTRASTGQLNLVPSCL